MTQLLTTSTLFPYTTLFRSNVKNGHNTVAMHRIIFCFILKNLTVLFSKTSQKYKRDSRNPLYCSFIDKSPFDARANRSEEHTSELQSRENLVCRLLLEKKKK